MKAVSTYADALEVVHSLATSNQISALDIAFGEDQLDEQRKWQQVALDTLQDLVTNHADAIDDRFQAPAEPDAVESLADRADDPNDPVSAVKICIDLGRHAIVEDPELDEEARRQVRAVALAETFVSRHGGDITAAMTSFRMG